MSLYADRGTREDRALGHHLKALRGRFGFTQQQVADCLNVHRPAIAEMEHGHRRITLLEGYRLAHLYGIPLDFLTAGVGRAGRDPGQPAGRMRPLPPWFDHMRQLYRQKAAGSTR